jgi:dissimilatory sulfite reductase (desulfoviridin) alpha/beta subunit
VRQKIMIMRYAHLTRTRVAHLRIITNQISLTMMLRSSKKKIRPLTKLKKSTSRNLITLTPRKQTVIKTMKLTHMKNYLTLQTRLKKWKVSSNLTKRKAIITCQTFFKCRKTSTKIYSPTKNLESNGSTLSTNRKKEASLATIWVWAKPSRSAVTSRGCSMETISKGF